MRLPVSRGPGARLALRLLLRPQIDDAAGLAGRAFDATRIADHDLDPDADVAADVRGERRGLRRARGFVGMVWARLDQEPHDVEPLLAAKLDLIMRREALAAQQLLLDLGGKPVNAAHV